MTEKIEDNLQHKMNDLDDRRQALENGLNAAFSPLQRDVSSNRSNLRHAADGLAEAGQAPSEFFGDPGRTPYHCAF